MMERNSAKGRGRGAGVNEDEELMFEGERRFKLGSVIILVRMRAATLCVSL